jgi:hypothetical protein
MRTASLLASLLVVAVAACEQGKAPPPAAQAPVNAAATASSKIARIVFIDQETACDCTRKRIEGTWTALQAALGAPATLPVERIHLDTQAAQADAYTLLKPLMVTPGVYFVDERNGVVEMLQGEVRQDQLVAILKRPQ